MSYGSKTCIPLNKQHFSSTTCTIIYDTTSSYDARNMPPIGSTCKLIEVDSFTPLCKYAEIQNASNKAIRITKVVTRKGQR